MIEILPDVMPPWVVHAADYANYCEELVRKDLRYVYNNEPWSPTEIHRHMDNYLRARAVYDKLSEDRV